MIVHFLSLVSLALEHFGIERPEPRRRDKEPALPGFERKRLESWESKFLVAPTGFGALDSDVLGRKAGQAEEVHDH
jgi:hypothetical protein